MLYEPWRSLVRHLIEASSRIHAALGQLSNLTSLILHSNQLEGVIPESLGKLHNLTFLKLSSNQLSGRIPESLGELSNLTSLSLHSNQLEGTIPESLGQLRNLTFLKLSSNQLCGAIPESLGQLDNLKYMDLQANQLSGGIPESFGQLSELVSLILHSNKLNGPIPNSLGMLFNLLVLSLENNRLSGSIPDSLGQLSNLTSLSLERNQLSGNIPESLGELSNLTSLTLHSNRLSGISEEAARGLHRLALEEIYLENNPWIEPPGGVVDRGFERIVGYWEAINISGVIVSWKLKVALVGAIRAGKTSLARGMIHGEPHPCREEERTKGVDVHVCEPCKPNAERSLELIFWDFAGHEEYYSTHQIFLSKGALHILVVDLLRFSYKPSERYEMVNVWLDALQRHVPGSNVLVVATKSDQLTGGLEANLRDIQHRVESHLSSQRDEFDRTRDRTSTSSDMQQLIFHGVETVSSTCAESLSALRLRLATLVYSERDKFPSVGRRYPKLWIRVSAMLDARRSGQNPIEQASLRCPVRHDQGRLEANPTRAKFLHRTDAIEEWGRVVWTLSLESEVMSNERNSEEAVFEDAVRQLVREGTILDSGKVLFLEPTWINELLKAILDHELADDTKDDFWENEIKRFSKGDPKVYWNLTYIHNNFPSTGILTVRYLRFLWRGIPEISDNSLFEALLDIMSHHGVIFRGNPSGASSEHAGNALDDSTELFVALHLPSTIVVSDLEEFATVFKHQFREELVYEIRQPYVPPGILGLLMARLLLCEDIKFRKCWGRGAVFTLGEVLILLHLDTPSHGSKEARITVNLFGERFVSAFSTAINRVENEIQSMFFESFHGLFVAPRQGPIRCVPEISADDGRNAVDGMSATDVVNAVVKGINGLEKHIDRKLSCLIQRLHQLEISLQDVTQSCRTTLARLNKLQSKEVPCPNLLIIRPAAAVVSDEQKPSLWAMMGNWCRRAKSLVYRDMRLCFLCPHDFSEVPCGLDGNGYPLATIHERAKKIYPVLKATAVIVKMAITAAGGVDLPVPEFLNGTLAYIEDGLDDHVVEAIENALSENMAVPREVGGEVVSVVGEGEVKTLVGNAYRELKGLMETYEPRRTEGFVHFDAVMQREDDGQGGQIWVSKNNVEEWRRTRA